MCYVKCSVEDGLISSEKSVRIRTAEGGIEEVSVPSVLVTDNLVKAFYIGQESDRTLIEFPRESSSGKWRAWVPNEAVQSGK